MKIYTEKDKKFKWLPKFVCFVVIGYAVLVTVGYPLLANIAK